MKKLLKDTCIFIIILIIIMTYQAYKNKNEIMKYFYKDKYREYVEECANKYELDEYLIFAIIKAESNFNENATSKANAKGLMQIMDSTGSDIAKEMDMSLEEDSLLDPKINIELGTKYIDMLIEKYNSLELALAAYNAGSGNVDKWINENVLESDGSNIENIPYQETNNYVRKILRDYKIYKEIY